MVSQKARVKKSEEGKNKPKPVSLSVEFGKMPKISLL